MSDTEVGLAAYLEGKAVLERLAHGHRGATTTSRKTPEADLAALAGPARFIEWPEAAFASLVETLPDALVVIAANGAIALVNRQLESMFGYARAELLGRPIEILMPERYRGTHVGQRNGHFANPRTRPMGADLDLVGRRKDGTEFPVEIGLSPLKTERGVFATGLIRDISSRRRDQAKFRTLIENIPAVTFIAPLDESDPELYVSPQIEQMLGFSQKEWLEDPVLWHRQLHPEDRERWNRQFASTCAAGEPFRSVYRFLAKDGRVVWVQGYASVILDAEGKPSFLQGVAFDITSIKEAEAQLRQFNELLEARVAERTEELKELNAALTRSNQDLDDFAYITSHDLKEPLRGIGNYATFLIEDHADKLDDDGRAKLDTVVRLSVRMTHLLDGLLQFSRVGRVELAFGPVDLNEVLRHVLDSLRLLLEEKRVVVRIPQALPTIPCDRVRVGEIFLNLIANAVKYNDKEARWVEVGVLETTRPGAATVLYVRDNGIGIRDKHKSAVFRMFKRLNAPEKFGGGSGVGLTIVQKIVQRHRGRIWIESEFGVGTTFFFTLEAEEPENRENLAETSDPDGRGQP
ncbi:MAG TPA: PAS domain S-box protein [Gemmataceae bacterium]|jgi:PAS domain S-box-containing protein|nr:PAS domain S-box protein [Gemmataceae bacterium]